MWGSDFLSTLLGRSADQRYAVDVASVSAKKAGLASEVMDDVTMVLFPEGIEAPALERVSRGGAKVIDRQARAAKADFLDMRGCSTSKLKYMRCRTACRIALAFAADS